MLRLPGIESAGQHPVFPALLPKVESHRGCHIASVQKPVFHRGCHIGGVSNWGGVKLGGCQIGGCHIVGGHIGGVKMVVAWRGRRVGEQAVFRGGRGAGVILSAPRDGTV